MAKYRIKSNVLIGKQRPRCLNGFQNQHELRLHATDCSAACRPSKRLPRRGSARWGVIASLLVVAVVVLFPMSGCSKTEIADRDPPLSDSATREIETPPITVQAIPSVAESVSENVTESESSSETAADSPNPNSADDAAVAESEKDTEPMLTSDVADGNASSEPIPSLLSEMEIPEGTMGPEDYNDWAKPDLTLVVTGNQQGYIEPCGCTGLENQKGGVARRYTFIDQLRSGGWEVVPIDAGNQVRRFGRQAEIKFQRSAEALRQMGYASVGFGPDDLRLGVGELISVAASESAEEALYVSANVVLIDPSLMPQYKVIEKGGMKVGMTSILDPDSLQSAVGSELLIEPAVNATKQALEAIEKESPDFRVLTFYGSEEAASKLVREVPGFDLVVVAGGYGEPTYQAQSIEGAETKMIVTGNKAMYVGVVGLYPDQPMKYCRVAMTEEFEDAPPMRKLMADYQNQLRDLGLEALGLRPIPHPSGREFVGSEACSKCHTTAYEIWEGTPHAHATESLVHPGERGDVPRHFDPECISCHVTGWNAQNFYPYVSGYLSLEGTPHLTNSGCEGCHGPGADHVAAEEAGSTVSEEQRVRIRDAMRLPYEEAREHCMQCHDLDNSPDFHVGDAFEDIYWPQVEHYGMD